MSTADQATMENKPRSGNNDWLHSALWRVWLVTARSGLTYLDFLCLSRFLFLSLGPVQELLPEQRRLVVLRQPAEQSPAGTPLTLPVGHTQTNLKRTCRHVCAAVLEQINQ